MKSGIGAGFALLVALAGPLHAQDAPRFGLTLEGGWSQSDFTRAYAGTQGPAANYTQFFTDDAGHYGKAALSFGFAKDWDTRLSFSGLSFPTSLKGSFLGCCILSTWTSVEMKAVDLDVGLHRQFGGADVRFGAGVVSMEVQSDLHQNVIGSSFQLVSGDTYDTQKFTGIGPKLSVDVSLRVPKANGERLIAGLSVATLSGDLEQERSAPDGIGGQVDSSGSVRRELVNAGAYLGLSLPIGSGDFRGGFRRDFVEVSCDDPLAIGTGFLQAGVASTTFFLGYDLKF
ncbi:MAG: Lpg1974 family pore-forming outer membrane protein [Deltaproteobacteria bacterium]